MNGVKSEDEKRSEDEKNNEDEKSRAKSVNAPSATTIESNKNTSTEEHKKASIVTKEKEGEFFAQSS